MDSMKTTSVGFVKRKRVFGETSKFRLFKRVKEEHFDVFVTPQICKQICKSLLKKVLHVDRQWKL